MFDCVKPVPKASVTAPLLVEALLSMVKKYLVPCVAAICVAQAVAVGNVSVTAAGEVTETVPPPNCAAVKVAVVFCALTVLFTTSDFAYTGASNLDIPD